MSPRGNRVANSETKMKNFVGLSRQYYWVPDAQKSAASSPNPLGPFSHSGSLFSPRAERLIFDLEASYSNPCFKIDVFHTFKRLSTGE